VPGLLSLQRAETLAYDLPATAAAATAAATTTAAAATAAATTATTTTKSAATTAAAAAATTLTLLGFIDLESATIKDGAVHLRNGFHGGIVCPHGHEPKTARLPGLAIRHDMYVSDFAEL
jgi:hypothetical protein